MSFIIQSPHRSLSLMVLDEVRNAGNDFDSCGTQWDIHTGDLHIRLDGNAPDGSRQYLMFTVPDTELRLGGPARGLAYLREEWPTWFTPKRDPEQLEFQYYWRCAHYPSALENFQSTRQTCEWDCHTQELKWYHGGVHPTPKSWGTPREWPKVESIDLGV